MSAANLPAGIWLVGAGNMGGAMLRRWIAAGLDPSSVFVRNRQDRALPDGVGQGRAFPDAPLPPVLMLAMKPQQLGEIELPDPTSPPSSPQKRGSRVAEESGEALDTRFRGNDEVEGGQPILISILAGVEEATLAARYPGYTIVRAMPNLPVSLGKGVTALFASSQDPQARGTVEALMAPLGLVEWIADETLFGAVTALSGCGPGFVYRFVDALAEAGAALGLPPDQAMRLAVATVEGAGALAAQADEPPAVLADRVASPGGSTRAGLNVLDENEALKKLLRETLAASARRNAEMAAAARG